MRRVLIWALVLTALGVGQVWGQDAIKITGWQPLPFVAEPPYIILEVEYPHTLERPQEAITVNGRPARYRLSGGGSNPAARQQDYYLYVGAPGAKQVSVTLTSGGKHLSASTQLDFRSGGGILPLGRLAGEGVFSPGEWRYYVYFLKDIRVRVNGADLPHRLTPLPDSADHQLLTFAPALRAGHNTVEVTGKNPQGEERSSSLPVFFLKDHTVKVGDSFWFPYGEVGSKSGPFYRLLVEGAALKPLRETFLRRLTLTDDLWLGGVDLFSKELQAVAPGEVTLKVLEKRWFKDPGYHLKASFSLKVRP